MKEVLKNIPILGMFLRWFYNLLRLNRLFVAFRVQINEQQAQINEQQAQINEMKSQVEMLLGHNHVHHENYKKMKESIKQQVGRQISYHALLFHQRINRFTDEIKDSIGSKKELESLPDDTLSFVLDDYYLSFEETFRGSQELIWERCKEYLQYLKPGIKRALDIGCGRGEWVHLLQQNGIDAHGIDLNFAMLNAGMAKGIKNLKKADVFEFFKMCPDNTYDLVSAFHIIEHIPFEKLFLFLQEIKRIAAPNAQILLETPNPANLLVAAYTFYKDPTHLNPLPADVIAFMLEYIGFNEIQTHFLHPYPAEECIPEDSLTAARINNYFYSGQDYLITATNSKADCLPPKKAVGEKPKLAYVSPFPPLKTGIASYSASLIRHLERYYDIELILSAENMENMSVEKTFLAHSDEWFKTNYTSFDRVLYHFGNSSYHTYMINLLALIPGIVVLHDFYLSGAMSEEHMLNTNTLYRLHGYSALAYLQKTSMAEVEWRYPCNKEILQNALSIITHSEYSKTLCSSWYASSSIDFFTVPLLREPAALSESTDKKRLDLSQDTFVVCSFGLIGQSKKTLEIVNAWLSSSLSQDPRCYLIFVGDNDGSEYTQMFQESIKNHANIRITGWTDTQTFDSYLSIADLGIQLRAHSRGETSAALLDCLNYGISTIANANGSAAELPKDVLCMLEDEFVLEDLTQALESLYHDDHKREVIAQKAKEYMETVHNPDKCAEAYAQAIEQTYATPQRRGEEFEKISMMHDARTGSLLMLDSLKQKQILVDVSSIAKNDLKTGIERVVRSQIRELISQAPDSYRIESVYLTQIDGEYNYVYARNYSAELLGLEDITLPDEPIRLNPGDIFYGVDLCAKEVENATSSGLYQGYKSLGVKIIFAVYDLLPILKPHFFPPNMRQIHTLWIENIIRAADEVICISKSVADELTSWMQTYHNEKLERLRITAIPLGADILSSTPERIPSLNPAFLMVGTLEPRKGHALVLDAFERLWNNNLDVTLVIVGKAGWMQESLIERITSHSQFGDRLIWLGHISDLELSRLYASSDALIAASEAEGFGLPLIEAARHALPIIARDIPVFREVASDHAFFFRDTHDTEVLASAIQEWLKLYEQNIHPLSSNIPFLSWEENTQLLFERFR